MKKIISILMAVVMLFGCATVLAGCGGRKDDGAQINIYLGDELYDFDPSDFYVDSTAEQVMSLLFEPLFTIDAKGKLECAAAESYDVNTEEREIVVKLRESYWSDDVRVKAEDFVYAWCERILNPNNPNPAASLFYEIENAAAVKSGVGTVSDIGVKATGIYELTITYREYGDYELLLRNLASVAAAPIRQDIVESAPTYWSKLISKMVFSGPFKVRAFDSTTKELSLERNVGYHQDPLVDDYTKVVKPDTLISFVTGTGEEIEVSYADIESKTKFFMGDASLADRAEYKNKATVSADTSVYSYVFNTNNPILSNSKVRYALTIAIDRNAIVEAITFGKPADGLIPDISGGSRDALISASAATDEAKEILSEVDFSKISDKTLRLVVNDDEQSRAIAEIVKSAWEGLGVGIKVKVTYASSVATKIGDYEFEDSEIQVLAKEASYGNFGEFDVLAIDFQTYTTDAFAGLAAFTSNMNGGGVDFKTNTMRKNIAGWINSNYDSLVSVAYGKRGEERANILADAEELLIKNAPICPLVFNESFAFISSELRDVKTDGLGNFNFTRADLKNYQKYFVTEKEEEN